MNIRIIVVIAITTLIFITASATYFAATQKPEFREVLFFQQLWGNSSPGTATAMALPWTAVGVATPDSDTQPYFKPLPASFMLSREWYGSSYDDQGESLWTFLRSGEVIRFGFNSTEPLYMDCVFDQTYVRQMHTDAAYSYSGTLRIQRSGLYFFDFSVDGSVHRSVNATVSFTCLEALAGATYYQQQQTPEIADRSALVESVLTNAIGELLQNNQTSTINSVILLSTPNLYGVKVSEHILGVSVQTMTQDQIDALSKVKPVDYWYFDRILKTDLNTASVDLNYVWGYSNGHERVFGESGSYYVCSWRSGNWIASSNGGWAP